MKVNGPSRPHGVNPYGGQPPPHRRPHHTYLRLNAIAVPAALRSATAGQNLFDRDGWSVSARAKASGLMSLEYSHATGKGFHLIVDPQGRAVELGIFSNAHSVHPAQATIYNQLLHAPKDLPLFQDLLRQLGSPLDLIL